MNIALWIAQALVAILFLMASVMHVPRREQAMAQSKWMADVAPALLIFIAIVEFLGAVGVIVPALTGILRWLTPLAAAGLALMMVLAMGFHAFRGEYPNMAFNFILFALAAFVAYGRWVLSPL
jgi:putative oxidoreductase